MIAIFIILVSIVYIGYRISVAEGDKYRIKYDCRDKEVFWWVAVVSGVLAVIMMFLSNLPAADVQFLGSLLFIQLGGFLLFPTISVIAWIGYLSSSVYLRRLKIHGYELPANKREFSSSLCNLRKINESEVSVNSLSKESIVLSVISCLNFVLVIIYAVLYFFEYNNMNDVFGLTVLGYAPLLIFWYIRTFLFFRQRLRETYRDDVEVDETRKKRKPIEDGIKEMLILLFLTMVWIGYFNVITEFIYKSKY